MIALQDITFKHFSESDASAQDKEIDCLNADYLVVQFFTSGGSNGAMAELRLLESDTSGSGQAEISGTDLSSTVTSPSAVAADDGCALYFVDLRGRKRFITVGFDGPASSANYVAAFTLNDQRPITAASADWQGRVII
tara:strand:+ start:1120 stop:1533 length:414 start_codon:yes stop_codon:yes gene_type:complete